MEADDDASGQEALPLEQLRKYFHMNAKDACVLLQVSMGRLKRSCRVHNISRWPHRKLASLQNLRENIQAELNLSEADRQTLLARLDDEVEAVMLNPDRPIEKVFFDMRQTSYKVRYHRKARTTRPSSSGKRSSSKRSRPPGQGHAAAQQRLASAAAAAIAGTSGQAGGTSSERSTPSAGGADTHAAAAAPLPTRISTRLAEAGQGSGRPRRGLKRRAAGDDGDSEGPSSSGRCTGSSSSDDEGESSRSDEGDGSDSGDEEWGRGSAAAKRAAKRRTLPRGGASSGGVKARPAPAPVQAAPRQQQQAQGAERSGPSTGSGSGGSGPGRGAAPSAARRLHSHSSLPRSRGHTPAGVANTAGPPAAIAPPWRPGGGAASAPGPADEGLMEDSTSFGSSQGMLTHLRVPGGGGLPGGLLSPAAGAGVALVAGGAAGSQSQGQRMVAMLDGGGTGTPTGPQAQMQAHGWPPSGLQRISSSSAGSTAAAAAAAALGQQQQRRAQDYGLPQGLQGQPADTGSPRLSGPFAGRSSPLHQSDLQTQQQQQQQQQLLLQQLPGSRQAGPASVRAAAPGGGHQRPRPSPLSMQVLPPNPALASPLPPPYAGASPRHAQALAMRLSQSSSYPWSPGSGLPPGARVPSSSTPHSQATAHLHLHPGAAYGEAAYMKYDPDMGPEQVPGTRQYDAANATASVFGHGGPGSLQQQQQAWLQQQQRQGPDSARYPSAGSGASSGLPMELPAAYQQAYPTHSHSYHPSPAYQQYQQGPLNSGREPSAGSLTSTRPGAEAGGPEHPGAPADPGAGAAGWRGDYPHHHAMGQGPGRARLSPREQWQASGMPMDYVASPSVQQYSPHHMPPQPSPLGLPPAGSAGGEGWLGTGTGGARHSSASSSRHSTSMLAAGQVGGEALAGAHGGPMGAYGAGPPVGSRLSSFTGMAAMQATCGPFDIGGDLLGAASPHQAAPPPAQVQGGGGGSSFSSRGQHPAGLGLGSGAGGHGHSPPATAKRPRLDPAEEGGLPLERARAAGSGGMEPSGGSQHQQHSAPAAFLGSGAGRPGPGGGSRQSSHQSGSQLEGGSVGAGGGGGYTGSGFAPAGGGAAQRYAFGGGSAPPGLGQGHGPGGGHAASGGPGRGPGGGAPGGGRGGSAQQAAGSGSDSGEGEQEVTAPPAPARRDPQAQLQQQQRAGNIAPSAEPPAALMPPSSAAYYHYQHQYPPYGDTYSYDYDYDYDYESYQRNYHYHQQHQQMYDSHRRRQHEQLYAAAYSLDPAAVAALYDSQQQHRLQQQVSPQASPPQQHPQQQQQHMHALMQPQPLPASLLRALDASGPMQLQRQTSAPLPTLPAGSQHQAQQHLPPLQGHNSDDAVRRMSNPGSRARAEAAAGAGGPRNSTGTGGMPPAAAPGSDVAESSGAGGGGGGAGRPGLKMPPPLDLLPGSSSDLAWEYGLLGLLTPQGEGEGGMIGSGGLLGGGFEAADQDQPTPSAARGPLDAAGRAPTHPLASSGPGPGAAGQQRDLGGAPASTATRGGRHEASADPVAPSHDAASPGQGLSSDAAGLSAAAAGASQQAQQQRQRSLSFTAAGAAALSSDAPLQLPFRSMPFGPPPPEGKPPMFSPQAQQQQQHLAWPQLSGGPMPPLLQPRDSGGARAMQQQQPDWLSAQLTGRSSMQQQAYEYVEGNAGGGGGGRQLPLPPMPAAVQQQQQALGGELPLEARLSRGGPAVVTTGFVPVGRTQSSSLSLGMEAQGAGPGSAQQGGGAGGALVSAERQWSNESTGRVQAGPQDAGPQRSGSTGQRQQQPQQ